ncbi:MAG: type II toxin-antitoxin system PemK/MazF family toxin [Desulfamplus sp.]|nr:type II toxin-antitoxin system PemK/MazF family toxin [Desulfamplus sp.]
MEVKVGDIVLCRFYFSDLKTYKNRPVLVFVDNLPFDDFIAIPISSRIDNLHKDEFVLELSDFASGVLPAKSKIMIRKTFVVSKEAVIKKYAEITKNCFEQCHHEFCCYFRCA